MTFRTGQWPTLFVKERLTSFKIQAGTLQPLLQQKRLQRLVETFGRGAKRC